MNGRATVSTRAFSAGQAAFVVHCPSPKLCGMVEALFTDLPPAPTGSAVTDIVVRENDDQFAIQIGEDPPIPSQALEPALARLVTAVSRLALDVEPARLHLHSAGLSRNGVGVLVSAPSGTGKTTLSAGLSMNGWTYVSDEAVAFELGSTCGFGFPKPLVVKPGGASVLPALDALSVVTPSDELSWRIVPIGSVTDRLSDRLEPSLVVLLRRSADGSVAGAPMATPIHPADAVVALMGETMDAERFGRDAVALLASIAAGCSCYSVTVGPLREVVDLVQALADGQSSSMPVRDLGRPADPDANGWLVPSGVRSMLLGDRVIVHDTLGGSIVALDESGTAVWRSIHDDAPDWFRSADLSVAEISEFLSLLASHRFLVKPAPSSRAEMN